MTLKFVCYFYFWYLNQFILIWHILTLFSIPYPESLFHTGNWESESNHISDSSSPPRCSCSSSKEAMMKRNQLSQTGLSFNSVLFSYDYQDYVEDMSAEVTESILNKCPKHLGIGRKMRLLKDEDITESNQTPTVLIVVLERRVGN